MLKKYLISLDKDIQRRELFFSQKNTEDFQVFSAINTMQKDWDELVSIFNIEQFKAHYGRNVTKGEIGCTLSHLSVYQKIVEDNDIAEDSYALVCEDDALFHSDFQQNLTALLAEKLESEIVLVGQSKINDFNDADLEINYPTTFSFLCKKTGNVNYAFPYKSYFAGTVGYLIKKSAARTFIQQVSQNKPFWLADDFLLFEQDFNIRNKVVRPLMVIENPVLISNLESIRGSLSNNLFKKLMKYPLKKIFAIKKNLSN